VVNNKLMPRSPSRIEKTKTLSFGYFNERTTSKEILTSGDQTRTAVNMRGEEWKEKTCRHLHLAIEIK